jgi:hypothetical protein
MLQIGINHNFLKHFFYTMSLIANQAVFEIRRFYIDRVKALGTSLNPV